MQDNNTIDTNDTHAPHGGVIAGSLNAGRRNITNEIIPVYTVGDRFLNTITGNTNTIINVKNNHYYRGSDSYGPQYTLVVSKGDEIVTSIKATPAMLHKLFKKIEENFKFV